MNNCAKTIHFDKEDDDLEIVEENIIPPKDRKPGQNRPKLGPNRPKLASKIDPNLKNYRKPGPSSSTNQATKIEPNLRRNRFKNRC